MAVSPSFMQPLHDRLNESEILILNGQFLSSYHNACAILDDLIALTNVNIINQKSKYDKSKDNNNNNVGLLLYHRCVIQCVCESCIILCLQALYEMNSNDEQINSFIHKYYYNIYHMPYNVYIIYIQMYINKNNQYEYVVNNIIQYIHKHKNNNKIRSNLLYNNYDNSNSNKEDIDNIFEHIPYLPLSDQQYISLIELLILYGLCPLHKYNDAYKCIELTERHMSNNYKNDLIHKIDTLKQQYDTTLQQQQNDSIDKSPIKIKKSNNQQIDTVNNNNNSNSTSLSTTTRQQQLTQSERGLQLLHNILNYITIHKRYITMCVILITLLYAIAKHYTNSDDVIKQHRNSIINKLNQYPVFTIIKRELRNFVQLAFSNMLGQSVSQVFNSVQ